MQIATSSNELKLDSKLELLIDQFERDVAPYDRWSRIAAITTSAGVVTSVVLSMLLLPSAYIPYAAIGGILASIIMTKLPILYADHKKHEISTRRYKPITGVCMCDLYQYRTHLRRMEMAATTAERIRHNKLANYYKHQMGL
ncbi:MAG: hypothetical protein M3270_03595 [Thermoproteota archaeon]|nr:hypothetical protein [Thermoproteota archaeon]